MEDLKKLDEEIVKAAEALVDAYGQHGPWERQHIDSLRWHVAAKREAQRPKLLSAEEAYNLYWDASDLSLGRMKDILDADRASILKVIEGLPHYGSGTLECVKLSDIRSALSTREG